MKTILNEEDIRLLVEKKRVNSLGYSLFSLEFNDDKSLVEKLQNSEAYANALNLLKSHYRVSHEEKNRKMIQIESNALKRLKEIKGVRTVVTVVQGQDGHIIAAQFPDSYTASSPPPHPISNVESLEEDEYENEDIVIVEEPIAAIDKIEKSDVTVTKSNTKTAVVVDSPAVQNDGYVSSDGYESDDLVVEPETIPQSQNELLTPVSAPIVRTRSTVVTNRTTGRLSISKSEPVTVVQEQDKQEPIPVVTNGPRPIARRTIITNRSSPRQSVIRNQSPIVQESSPQLTDNGSQSPPSKESPVTDKPKVISRRTVVTSRSAPRLSFKQDEPVEVKVTDSTTFSPSDNSPTTEQAPISKPKIIGRKSMIPSKSTGLISVARMNQTNQTLEESSATKTEEPVEKRRSIIKRSVIVPSRRMSGSKTTPVTPTESFEGNNQNEETSPVSSSPVTPGKTVKKIIRKSVISSGSSPKVGTSPTEESPRRRTVIRRRDSESSPQPPMSYSPSKDTQSFERPVDTPTAIGSLETEPMQYIPVESQSPEVKTSLDEKTRELPVEEVKVSVAEEPVTVNDISVPSQEVSQVKEEQIVQQQEPEVSTVEEPVPVVPVVNVAKTDEVNVVEETQLSTSTESSRSILKLKKSKLFPTQKKKRTNFAEKKKRESLEVDSAVKEEKPKCNIDEKIEKLSFLKKTSAFSEHPLLDKLRTDLISLFETQIPLSDEQNVLISVDGKTPSITTILQDIQSILTHRAKLVRKVQYNLYTIFRPLKAVRRIEMIKDFERYDDVKRLLDNKNHSVQAKCNLFLQYLLQKKYLGQIVSELLISEIHLKDCYETGSILLSFKYRNAIIALITYLQDNINFNFSFLSENPYVFDQFSPELRKQVRNIVKYFLEKHENTGQELTDIGDEYNNPGIKYLILTTICPALLNFCTHGLKKGDGMFLKLKSGVVSHFWDIIVFCANSAELKSKEFGNGVDLLSIVLTVNEVVNTKSPLMSKQDLATKKFEAFVCFCLNYKIVEKCFNLMIIRSQKLLARYYTSNAVALDPEQWQTVMKTMTPLTELPFKLSLV